MLWGGGDGGGGGGDDAHRVRLALTPAVTFCLENSGAAEQAHLSNSIRSYTLLQRRYSSFGSVDDTGSGLNTSVAVYASVCIPNCCTG